MRTVGIYDCCQMNGVPYLIKEKNIGIEERLNSPESIVTLMRSDPFHMHRLAEEHCYILALNTKSCCIGIFFVSKGTVNISCITPREVFIRLCSIGAVSFVMVHNHPSGDVSPSEEDRRFARTLKEAGSIIGIDLQDFLIIGGSEDESYYSFKEKSVL